MVWGLFDHPAPLRRRFISEVVQTSTMDCGPAALQAILAGFGIEANYARLREACQTDVDGTSIDTLEDLAKQLGLEVAQVMLPADHLLLAQTESLPALVVLQLPNGLPHFVVVWRLHGKWVQIMDPASGRHWVRKKVLQNTLYQHQQMFATNVWRDWAASASFCDPLRVRMAKIGLDVAWSQRLLDVALTDVSWRSMAALDAATRMLTTLVKGKGLHIGAEAGRVLEQFLANDDQIPQAYWSVQAHPEDPNQLMFLGIVLLQFHGLAQQDVTTTQVISPVVNTALKEPASKPETHIFTMLQADGLVTPGLLVLALVLAVIGVTLEILILRGLLEIADYLSGTYERVGVVIALALFLGLLLALELPIMASVQCMGRKLEVRLRQAFLEKLPRLDARFFHSRLTSDMSQRAYELRQINELPEIGTRFLRLSLQIFLVSAGLIWLSPGSGILIVLAVFTLFGIALLTQPLLREQDLRFRAHIGALSRFYFDALQGLVPIRAHAAKRAIRTEHDRVLLEWTRAGVNFFRVHEVVSLIMLLASNSFAIWLLSNYLQHGGEAGGTLILLYWTLQLPILGQALATTAWQYPMMRNRVLRLLEPLSAPDESTLSYPDDVSVPDAIKQQHGQDRCSQTGATITLHQVRVEVARHTILQEINLQIESGEHVAIVGVSGAGKSTLASLLLGFNRPIEGSIWVDGKLLQGTQLQQLRQQTAWVDPDVRLWNRSLSDNLRYGAQTEQISYALKTADLEKLVQQLPEGMATVLGEGGALVAGGEGQRVRLGRALLRNARLVILDEPFRGLERSKRKRLLQQSRTHWQAATLLFISHDISSTQDFDRVVVIEQGHIVENQTPHALLAQPHSRYRELLNAEIAIRKKLHNVTQWRHLHLKNGKLSEKL